MSIPTPHPPAAYTMEELTAATGVTARTVRYYIVEGLLPPPEGAGPATTYSDVHRNRLLLIGTMKDAYLPLKEIRRRLATMREDEIADAVAPHEDVSSSHFALDDIEGDVAWSDDDASTYLDRILGPRTRPAARQSPPAPSAPSSGGSPRRGSPPQPAPPTTSSSHAYSAPAQSWKRLSITPEAELMIEEETFHRRQSQIEAALDWLRRILNGS